MAASTAPMVISGHIVPPSPAEIACAKTLPRSNKLPRAVPARSIRRRFMRLFYSWLYLCATHVYMSKRQNA